MFFIFGLSHGEKKIDYDKSIRLEKGNIYYMPQIYVTYTYFSVFFIPILKWNKKYYVTLEETGYTFELEQTIGRKIEKKESVTIEATHLKSIISDNTYTEDLKVCNICKFNTYENYQYCPKCGHLLKNSSMSED